jgi:hypothetical protein
LSKNGLNCIAQYLIRHNYDKCYVAVKENNIPSIKSCRKAGFLPEFKIRGIKILSIIKFFSKN